jgi:AcrR family transcriptional regulator
MTADPSTEPAGGAGRSGRAAPLPPDERRRSILRAVRPVLLERGVNVTTKELAQAAGVAEGTLFRVFDDKLSLIGEAAFVGADPAAAVPDIDAIDRSGSLRDHLVEVMRIGSSRVDEMMRWFAILHDLGRVDPRPEQERRTAAQEGWQHWMRRQTESEAEVRDAMVRLLTPHAHELRVAPERAVELFNVVLVGATMSTVDAKRRGIAREPLDPVELVDLFLDGVQRAAASDDDGPPTARSSSAPSPTEPERVP